MRKSKILIILPNGLGLRNFVFSDFAKLAKDYNMELIFWNATDFDLSKLGFREIKLSGKPHFKTNLLKRARKILELKQNSKIFKNDVYKLYLLKSNSESIKSKVKQILVWFYTIKYNNKLKKLKVDIQKYEISTIYFKNCLKQLRKIEPDLVFIPSQRPTTGLAPILASKSLNIPTVSFIFSWDNMPKGLMVVDADYYFVWSKHMLEETKQYYPHIKASHIRITGTPQFEMHYQSENMMTKSEFYKSYNLDINKRYICFSGNDITTSPHDELYLKHILESVESLNKKDYDFGVIFRKNPVDKTNRFDKYLIEYEHICKRIDPIWILDKNPQNNIPKKEDQKLLLNTIRHSVLLINLGSSMVFDAACHDVPCAYINYNPEVIPLKKDVKNIYKYIHFESMTHKDAVIWITSKSEIEKKILEGIKYHSKYVENAKDWFKVINHHPVQNASKRIVLELKNIIGNKDYPREI